jgi:hypothetical protein
LLPGRLVTGPASPVADFGDESALPGAPREKPRIKPVPEAFVATVLPLVPPTIKTMIEVQRLCGGRLCSAYGPCNEFELRATY